MVITSPIYNPMRSLLRFIYKYKCSLVMLIIVATQFYVRTYGQQHIKDGFAFSWVILGLCAAVTGKNLLHYTGVFFTGLMAFTVIDNHFFDLKHFTSADLFFVLSVTAASVIYALYEYKGKGITVQERNGSILLLVVAAFILLGRNYLDYYPAIFSILHWGPIPAGNPYFKSDAFAHILAAALFVYSTRKLDRRIAVYYLLLAASNYVDEMYFDPTKDTPSEWALIVIIHLACIPWVAFYIRQLHLKNELL